MIAVDTNILIRLIVRDDEAQYAASVRLLEQCPLHVSLTVLLETSWVLEHTLMLPRASVVAALSGLLQHQKIVVENENEAEWAIERYEQGADFADMIHLVTNREMSSFATFDRQIALRVGNHCPVPVMDLNG